MPTKKNETKPTKKKKKEKPSSIKRVKMILRKNLRGLPGSGETWCEVKVEEDQRQKDMKLGEKQKLCAGDWRLWAAIVWINL